MLIPVQYSNLIAVRKRSYEVQLVVSLTLARFHCVVNQQQLYTLVTERGAVTWRSVAVRSSLYDYVLTYTYL